ncbi:unnamed protein product [Camellia sinensis]
MMGLARNKTWEPEKLFIIKDGILDSFQITEKLNSLSQIKNFFFMIELPLIKNLFIVPDEPVLQARNVVDMLIEEIIGDQSLRCPNQVIGPIGELIQSSKKMYNMYLSQKLLLLGVLSILRGVKLKYNLKPGMRMSHLLISGVVIKIVSPMVATSGLLTKIRFWGTTQRQRKMAEGPVEGVGVLRVKRATVKLNYNRRQDSRKIHQAIPGRSRVRTMTTMMMGRKECGVGKKQNLGAVETISFASCWSIWEVNLFYY